MNKKYRIIFMKYYKTSESTIKSNPYQWLVWQPLMCYTPPPPKLIWLPGRQWFQSEIEKFSSTIFLLDSKSIFSTKYWSLKNTERRRERQRRDRDRQRQRRQRDRGERERNRRDRERGFIFIGSLNVERKILCRIYQM